MFTYNGQKMVTWNPFTGCNFGCTYCWARKLAEGKLKKAYPNGFCPDAHPGRYTQKFKPDDFVFVCSMGDISFAPYATILAIHDNIANNPETKFLFCTKQPSIYSSPEFNLKNVYWGVTIESNRGYDGMTRSPLPSQRYIAMSWLKHPHKFISIEPIIDFDVKVLIKWMREIRPEIVEVGADNYTNGLPEPAPDKVNALLDALKDFVPTVVEKQGLERLK